MFTDAWGENTSWCCSSLIRVSGEPSSFNQTNNGSFTTQSEFGEINDLKNGVVFTEHGYPALESQFTILNINATNGSPLEISAGIASPGGTWTGAIRSNPNDPEGDGILPRRFINTSLSAGPTEILELLDEIFEYDLNI